MATSPLAACAGRGKNYAGCMIAVAEIFAARRMLRLSRGRMAVPKSLNDNPIRGAHGTRAYFFNGGLRVTKTSAGVTNALFMGWGNEYSQN